MHFSSISNVAYFLEALWVLALFWINMRVRNTNSHDFLIKLTYENGLQQASTPAHVTPSIRVMDLHVKNKIVYVISK